MKCQARRSMRDMKDSDGNQGGNGEFRVESDVKVAINSDDEDWCKDDRRQK